MCMRVRLCVCVSVLARGKGKGRGEKEGEKKTHHQCMLCPGRRGRSAVRAPRSRGEGRDVRAPPLCPPALLT